MAFTGTATIEQVSDRKIRITGLSLAGDASGTIGFPGEDVAAEVELPALTSWIPFKNAEGDLVSLAAAIECRVAPTTDVGVAVPVSIAKSGSDQSDFKLTLHNDLAGGGQASGTLEIYVEYH